MNEKLILNKLDEILERLDNLEAPESEIMTIQEVAEYTGKSYSTIAQATRLGLLRSSGKRNKVIKKEWVDEYLEKGVM